MPGRGGVPVMHSLWSYLTLASCGKDFFDHIETLMGDEMPPWTSPSISLRRSWLGVIN